MFILRERERETDTYLSLDQQLLSLKTMTEGWYNAVLEKDKSRNTSMLIHIYLYNWSYCYAIKSNDHMNFKVVLKFWEKKMNFHIQGKIT